jgi:ferredoxin
MASLKRKLLCNAEGDFFVDDACIDCSVCREFAPEVFGDGINTACVRKQPEGKEEKKKALMALISCPVGAIGTLKREEARKALWLLPQELEEGVYRCGYASRHSYGAISYFIKHHEGNWFVDAPRRSGHLLQRLRELGGVKYIFLTHEDDVGDASFYAQAFGARVIIHEKDSRAYPSAHIKIKGYEPVIMGDFTLIPTPGHTPGHMVLLYKNFLFTGDHIWYSRDKDSLWASKEYCWYSWEEQKRSIGRLLNYSFEWVLPCHGYSV